MSYKIADVIWNNDGTMKTELTPLEALEKLTNYKCSRMSEKVECKEIIEKALKDYEMEHTLRIRVENINYELVREKQDNEKKFKAFAFDIIKRELMLEVKEDDGLYRLITYQSDNHLISKDQYDLLKEALEDD